jgi:hypothetical protein
MEASPKNVANIKLTRVLINQLGVRINSSYLNRGPYEKLLSFGRPGPSVEAISRSPRVLWTTARFDGPMSQNAPTCCSLLSGSRRLYQNLRGKLSPFARSHRTSELTINYMRRLIYRAKDNAPASSPAYLSAKRYRACSIYSLLFHH